MQERYENDYENTANQWEETDEGGRVTYRERRGSRQEVDEYRQAGRRPSGRAPRPGSDGRRPAPSHATSAAHRDRAGGYAGERRVYRGDSRPDAPRGAGRGTRPAGRAAAVATAPDFYIQPVMLLVVALLALISIIMGVSSCVGGGAAGTASGDVAVSAAAANIEAAEKTTDANGIVHGTTADGISFTIVQAGAAATSVSSSASTTGSTGTAPADATGDATADAADAAGDAADAADGDLAVATAGASSSASGAATTAGDAVSFAAAGNQVAAESILAAADAASGQAGDSAYDFSSFYKEVKPFVQQSDLRLITQEGPVVGGQGSFQVSGSTSLISPAACANAIAGAGFNLVGLATEHSYDAGTEGIEQSLQVWQQYPQVVLGGSYSDQASRETVHMIESNGMRFAFLSYTYGDLSYTDVASEPNNYNSVPFVQADAQADIERAKQVADCVIVSMRWGAEDSADLTDNERQWAQWLADQGVGLVVGTHASGIQPVQYFTGAAGNQTPVVFGLGDLIGGGTTVDTTLSGIFTCDFARQSDGTVTVENAQWHPVVLWSDGVSTYPRLVENLTEDEVNANTLLADVTDAYQQAFSATNAAITQIPVQWGSNKSAAAAGSSSSSAAGASSSGTATTDGAADAQAAGTAGQDAGASGYVDEDGDGYDDNTGEYFGGGYEDDDAAGDAGASGYVDEDGDGYDDNTGEYFGGADDASSEDAGYTDDDGDGYDDSTGEYIG